MLFKKSAIILCSSSSIYPDLCVSITSSHRQIRPFPEPSTRSPSRHVRRYATVRDDGQSAEFKDSSNKQSSSAQWPSSPNPTPYEIFDQSKSAPYNKARFFELVKLYHPDRHLHTGHDGLSQRTKLKRYHLIVAANDILSDPARRRLYDLYGSGWGGQPDIQKSFRSTDRTWRQEPGNASMNATWEDWERWHQERDGQKQEPRFMSNIGFVSVLAIFVIIGAWGQATRAGKHSLTLVDMLDQRQEAINEEIRRRQRMSFGKSREDRVETFLRSREGWGYEEDSHPTQNIGK